MAKSIADVGWVEARNPSQSIDYLKNQTTPKRWVILHIDKSAIRH